LFFYPTNAAVRDAELNDKYHFHNLHLTFPSWLVQKGVSIYELSKLLGHADIKTTEIYAHLKENNLRSSVNLL
jgi:site-specific recombinase XerD